MTRKASMETLKIKAMLVENPGVWFKTEDLVAEMNIDFTSMANRMKRLMNKHPEIDRRRNGRGVQYAWLPERADFDLQPGAPPPNGHVPPVLLPSQPELDLSAEPDPALDDDDSDMFVTPSSPMLEEPQPIPLIPFPPAPVAKMYEEVGEWPDGGKVIRDEDGKWYLAIPLVPGR